MFWNKKKPEPVYRPSPEDDCEFDIENRPVFSVERTLDGRTEIWERLPSGESARWHFNCPLDKHTHFIRRFRAKLGLNVAGSEIRPIDQSKNIT